MGKPRRNPLAETAVGIASPSTPSSELRAKGAIVHQTLYLPRPLYRQLRQLAVVRECRMHDLLDTIFKEKGLKTRAELDAEMEFVAEIDPVGTPGARERPSR